VMIGATVVGSGATTTPISADRGSGRATPARPPHDDRGET